jgi:hypothetical protein
MVDSWRAP